MFNCLARSARKLLVWRYFTLFGQGEGSLRRDRASPRATGICHSPFPAEPRCLQESSSGRSAVAGLMWWVDLWRWVTSSGTEQLIQGCEALTQRNKSPGLLQTSPPASSASLPGSLQEKQRGETNYFTPGWFQLASPSLLPALPRDEDVVQQLITHRQAPSRQPTRIPRASSRRQKT